MNRVAVLGASGFIGSHIMTALDRHGVVVKPVQAPRLVSGARNRSELLREAEIDPMVNKLVHQLTGCDIIINAAGRPAAIAAIDDELVGANALLPAVVARARPIGSRLVHVSSAAVQGRLPKLDETTARRPFSAYSQTKAWGEEVLDGATDTVIFRPTSVQGAGRDVTRALVRFARSPLSSVAGIGDRPSPQVLVRNVADAIVFAALSPDPPPIVLQPWEGITTAGLLRRLGGKEPIHIPLIVANAIIACAVVSGRISTRSAGLARRLELAWLGQAQAPSWLATAGWTPIDDDWGILM